MLRENRVYCFLEGHFILLWIHKSPSSKTFSISLSKCRLQMYLQDVVLLPNLLTDMPVSGSSNSAGNEDLMSKIWTDGDTII